MTTKKKYGRYEIETILGDIIIAKKGDENVICVFPKGSKNQTSNAAFILWLLETSPRQMGAYARYLLGESLAITEEEER